MFFVTWLLFLWSYVLPIKRCGDDADDWWPGVRSLVAGAEVPGPTGPSPPPDSTGDVAGRCELPPPPPATNSNWTETSAGELTTCMRQGHQSVNQSINRSINQCSVFIVRRQLTNICTLSSQQVLRGTFYK